MGTPIVFGTNNDQNVIALVEYDKAGRVAAQRDPRGKRTSYGYDQLNRRTRLTDPLSHAWLTAYLRLNSGGSRVTVTDPLGHATQQDSDRLGRLASLSYLGETPKLTPDVTFGYDQNSSRSRMTEVNGASTVRETRYTYDQARRLKQVDFDTNGDGTIDQSVGYQYDAGGLRTLLTLPGSKTVAYQYDARRQLVSLTNWSGQLTSGLYDPLGRLVALTRSNGVRSQFQYDGAGRLRSLRHATNGSTLSYHAYTVDGRGNRTQAFEVQPRAATGTTTLAYNDPAVSYYVGNWTAATPYQTTSNVSAALQIACLGTTITLTMGQGPDHGLYDVYVDYTLWQSIDGYAASAGDRVLSIPVSADGPHVIDVRNRPEKNVASSGNTLRFKSLVVTGHLYDAQTIQYQYDALARLLQARYGASGNPLGTPVKEYDYTYDVAGNRTQQVVSVNGTPTTTTYSYDDANRLTSDGTHSLGYDTAGRLTSDGVNSYAWDRANRLLSVGSAAYQYNGVGQRVQQTIGATVTQYLLDVQPGLATILQATTGANTTGYVQGPLGIHAQQNPDGSWHWPLQDGLGSVRAVVDSTAAQQETRQYDPFGNELQLSGTQQTVFGFTGEETDANGLVNLRARYYNPAIGQFFNLDPLEGSAGQPLSLNRYAYVQDNPVNATDPSGMAYSCLAETGGVPEACQQLNEALTRAPSALASIYDTVDNSGHLVVDKLESVPEQLFNVKFALFSGMNKQNNPADFCSAGGPSDDIKRSAVTAMAALTHIVSKLSELTSTPLLDFQQRIGRGSFRFQFGAAAITGSEAYGRTPQGASSQPNNELYLGTHVTAATVVHEMGHHLDRINGPLSISGALAELWVSLDSSIDRKVGYAENFPHNKVPSRSYPVATQDGMGGQARLTNESGEVWADMFMNWVLANHYTRFGNADFEVIGIPGWTISNSYLEANAKASYVVVAVQHLLTGVTPAMDIDEVNQYVRNGVRYLPFPTF